MKCTSEMNKSDIFRYTGDSQSEDATIVQFYYTKEILYDKIPHDLYVNHHLHQVQEYRLISRLACFSIPVGSVA